MGEAQLPTMSEVAEQLRITDVTVRRWIQRNELSAINLGGPKRPEYRILMSALDEFIAVREGNAAA
jgi:excisionase family DNA binding protein